MDDDLATKPNNSIPKGSMPNIPRKERSTISTPEVPKEILDPSSGYPSRHYIEKLSENSGDFAEIIHNIASSLPQRLAVHVKEFLYHLNIQHESDQSLSFEREEIKSLMIGCISFIMMQISPKGVGFFKKGFDFEQFSTILARFANDNSEDLGANGGHSTLYSLLNVRGQIKPFAYSAHLTTLDTYSEQPPVKLYEAFDFLRRAQLSPDFDYLFIRSLNYIVDNSNELSVDRDTDYADSLIFLLETTLELNFDRHHVSKRSMSFADITKSITDKLISTLVVEDKNILDKESVLKLKQKLLDLFTAKGFDINRIEGYLDEYFRKYNTKEALDDNLDSAKFLQDLEHTYAYVHSFESKAKTYSIDINKFLKLKLDSTAAILRESIPQSIITRLPEIIDPLANPESLFAIDKPRLTSRIVSELESQISQFQQLKSASDTATAKLKNILSESNKGAFLLSKYSEVLNIESSDKHTLSQVLKLVMSTSLFENDKRFKQKFSSYLQDILTIPNFNLSRFGGKIEKISNSIKVLQTPKAKSIVNGDSLVQYKSNRILVHLFLELLHELGKVADNRTESNSPKYLIPIAGYHSLSETTTKRMTIDELILDRPPERVTLQTSESKTKFIIESVNPWNTDYSFMRESYKSLRNRRLANGFMEGIDTILLKQAPSKILNWVSRRINTISKILSRKFPEKTTQKLLSRVAVLFLFTILSSSNLGEKVSPKWNELIRFFKLLTSHNNNLVDNNQAIQSIQHFTNTLDIEEQKFRYLTPDEEISLLQILNDPATKSNFSEDSILNPSEQSSQASLDSLNSESDELLAGLNRIETIQFESGVNQEGRPLVNEPEKLFENDKNSATHEMYTVNFNGNEVSASFDLTFQKEYSGVVFEEIELPIYYDESTFDQENNTSIILEPKRLYKKIFPPSGWQFRALYLEGIDASDVEILSDGSLSFINSSPVRIKFSIEKRNVVEIEPGLYAMEMQGGFSVDPSVVNQNNYDELVQRFEDADAELESILSTYSPEALDIISKMYSNTDLDATKLMDYLKALHVYTGQRNWYSYNRHWIEDQTLTDELDAFYTGDFTIGFICEDAGNANAKFGQLSGLAATIERLYPSHLKADQTGYVSKLAHRRSVLLMWHNGKPYEVIWDATPSQIDPDQNDHLAESQSIHDIPLYLESNVATGTTGSRYLNTFSPVSPSSIQQQTEEPFTEPTDTQGIEPIELESADLSSPEMGFLLSPNHFIDGKFGFRLGYRIEGGISYKKLYEENSISIIYTEEIKDGRIKSEIYLYNSNSRKPETIITNTGDGNQFVIPGEMFRITNAFDFDSRKTFKENITYLDIFTSKKYLLTYYVDGVPNIKLLSYDTDDVKNLLETATDFFIYPPSNQTDIAYIGLVGSEGSRPNYSLTLIPTQEFSDNSYLVLGNPLPSPEGKSLENYDIRALGVGPVVYIPKNGNDTKAYFHSGDTNDTPLEFYLPPIKEFDTPMQFTKSDDTNLNFPVIDYSQRFLTRDRFISVSPNTNEPEIEGKYPILNLNINGYTYSFYSVSYDYQIRYPSLSLTDPEWKNAGGGLLIIESIVRIFVVGDKDVANMEELYNPEYNELSYYATYADGSSAILDIKVPNLNLLSTISKDEDLPFIQALRADRISDPYNPYFTEYPETRKFEVGNGRASVRVFENQNNYYAQIKTNEQEFWVDNFHNINITEARLLEFLTELENTTQLNDYYDKDQGQYMIFIGSEENIWILEGGEARHEKANLIRIPTNHDYRLKAFYERRNSNFEIEVHYKDKRDEKEYILEIAGHSLSRQRHGFNMLVTENNWEILFDTYKKGTDYYLRIPSGDLFLGSDLVDVRIESSKESYANAIYTVHGKDTTGTEFPLGLISVSPIGSMSDTQQTIVDTDMTNSRILNGIRYLPFINTAATSDEVFVTDIFEFEFMNEDVPPFYRFIYIEDTGEIAVFPIHIKSLFHSEILNIGKLEGNDDKEGDELYYSINRNDIATNLSMYIFSIDRDSESLTYELDEQKGIPNVKFHLAENMNDKWGEMWVKKILLVKDLSEIEELDLEYLKDESYAVISKTGDLNVPLVMFHAANPRKLFYIDSQKFQTESIDLGNNILAITKEDFGLKVKVSDNSIKGFHFYYMETNKKPDSPIRSNYSELGLDPSPEIFTDIAEGRRGYKSQFHLYGNMELEFMHKETILDWELREIKNSERNLLTVEFSDGSTRNYHFLVDGPINRTHRFYELSELNEVTRGVYSGVYTFDDTTYLIDTKYISKEILNNIKLPSGVYAIDANITQLEVINGDSYEVFAPKKTDYKFILVKNIDNSEIETYYFEDLAYSFYQPIKFDFSTIGYAYESIDGNHKLVILDPTKKIISSGIQIVDLGKLKDPVFRLINTPDGNNYIHVLENAHNSLYSITVSEEGEFFTKKLSLAESSQKFKEISPELNLDEQNNIKYQMIKNESNNREYIINYNNQQYILTLDSDQYDIIGSYILTDLYGLNIVYIIQDDITETSPSLLITGRALYDTLSIDSPTLETFSRLEIHDDYLDTSGELFKDARIYSDQNSNKYIVLDRSSLSDNEVAPIIFKYDPKSNQLTKLDKFDSRDLQFIEQDFIFSIAGAAKIHVLNEPGQNDLGFTDFTTFEWLQTNLSLKNVDLDPQKVYILNKEQNSSEYILFQPEQKLIIIKNTEADTTKTIRFAQPVKGIVHNETNPEILEVIFGDRSSQSNTLNIRFNIDTGLIAQETSSESYDIKTIKTTDGFTSQITFKGISLYEFSHNSPIKNFDSTIVHAYNSEFRIPQYLFTMEFLDGSTKYMITDDLGNNFNLFFIDGISTNNIRNVDIFSSEIDVSKLGFGSMLYSEDPIVLDQGSKLLFNTNLIIPGKDLIKLEGIDSTVVKQDEVYLITFGSNYIYPNEDPPDYIFLTPQIFSQGRDHNSFAIINDLSSNPTIEFISSGLGNNLLSSLRDDAVFVDGKSEVTIIYAIGKDNLEVFLYSDSEAKFEGIKSFSLDVNPLSILNIVKYGEEIFLISNYAGINDVYRLHAQEDEINPEKLSVAERNEYLRLMYPEKRFDDSGNIYFNISKVEETDKGQKVSLQYSHQIYSFEIPKGVEFIGYNRASDGFGDYTNLFFIDTSGRIRIGSVGSILNNGSSTLDFTIMDMPFNAIMSGENKFVLSFKGLSGEQLYNYYSYNPSTSGYNKVSRTPYLSLEPNLLELPVVDTSTYEQIPVSINYEGNAKMYSFEYAELADDTRNESLETSLEIPNSTVTPTSATLTPTFEEKTFPTVMPTNEPVVTPSVSEETIPADNNTFEVLGFTGFATVFSALLLGLALQRRRKKNMPVLENVQPTTEPATEDFPESDIQIIETELQESLAAPDVEDTFTEENIEELLSTIQDIEPTEFNYSIILFGIIYEMISHGILTQKDFANDNIQSIGDVKEFLDANVSNHEFYEVLTSGDLNSINNYLQNINASPKIYRIIFNYAQGLGKFAVVTSESNRESNLANALSKFFESQEGYIINSNRILKVLRTNPNLMGLLPEIIISLQDLKRMARK